MSGNTIGSLVGGAIGLAFGAPQLGFALGGALGGYIAPTKIKGPRLQDTQQQLSQEGAFIPFGYGTFPSPTQVVWQGPVVEHKKKSGGKGGGGVQQISYTYTRSYAIGVCEGEADVVKLWRNGKLVYDITPTSTITGNNAKWLAKCTFYRGDETQTVDPVIEAEEGVGNTGPMRGLCYFVVEDDETQAGEIAQYRAVVQKCGTRTDINDTVVRFVGSGAAGFSETSTTGASWPNNTGGGLGTESLVELANNGPIVVGSASSGQMFRSTDRGVTWTASTTVTNYPVTDLAYGNGRFLGTTTTGKIIYSLDDGDTWADTTPGYTFSAFTRIAFGGGVFVLVADNVYTGTTESNFAQTLAGSSYFCVAWNDTHFMIAGNNGSCYSSPDGSTWTFGSSPGTGNWSFYEIAGQSSYFIAQTGVGLGNGIWKTTDLGVNWTQVLAGGGTSTGSSAAGGGIVVFGSGSSFRVSDDDGATWATVAVSGADDVVYVGPSPDWYTVPDAAGVYADLDGVLQTSYVVGTEISACGAYLDDILADLCERGGIDATEYDASALSAVFVKGYPCATEGSPQSFIEPLTQAFFFDRGEWDKKIRFIPRGGASAFALTADDLVARDGPAIGQTKIQEVELLRKVSVITVDPAADYSPKPQVWERRSGTVQAKGESTVEIPIVADADTTKQIAHKRSNVAWSETEKFDFGLTRKWSKLTPTDVGTLTDKQGAVHRIRLQDTTESAGVFMVEEAPKDRASAYGSTATGTVHTPPTTTTPGLRGPTLFAAMALPMLRSSDNSPGFYIGACGVLDGWQGCVVLMSVDGGLSYQTALTITEPTIMGTIDADCTSSSTPIKVRVFGALESKTTAQVALGQNWSAIASVGGTAEIIGHETATSTGTRTYDLTVLTRGLDETVAAAHLYGDQFMDLSSAYFLPIPQSYAGGDILFKAVAVGVSPDAVDPVTVPWGGRTYVYDGGEVTP